MKIEISSSVVREKSITIGTSRRYFSLANIMGVTKVVDIKTV